MMLDAVDGYDPRGDLHARLDLVSLDTPDGEIGYIIGTEGVFTDVNGRVWNGSEVIKASAITSAIGSDAPSGSITLTYFQDPTRDDLQSEVRALGADYLRGRAIKFYWQPIRDASEFAAPKIAPVLEYTRTMGDVIFGRPDAQTRTITVPYEAWTEGRNYTRQVPFSREGHEKLLGAGNPSLTYRPTDNQEDEKLFG